MNKSTMLNVLRGKVVALREEDHNAIVNQHPLATQRTIAAQLAEASADYTLAIEDWAYYLQVRNMPYEASGMTDVVSTMPVCDCRGRIYDKEAYYA